jgi:hypothetical protein
MISIKKIMSVTAIAFAVMTIAGSGVLVSVNAAPVNPDPCSGTNKGEVSQCSSGIFKILGLDSIDPSKGVAGIQGVIISFASALIAIIAAVSVVYLIFGAYNMVSDSGDGKGYKAGLDRVKYAIIGLVVALLSFTIVTIVSKLIK